MNRKLNKWRASRNWTRAVIKRSPFRIPVWISTVKEDIHMPYLKQRWYQAKCRRCE